MFFIFFLSFSFMKPFLRVSRNVQLHFVFFFVFICVHFLDEHKIFCDFIFGLFFLLSLTSKSGDCL